MHCQKKKKSLAFRFSRSNKIIKPGNTDSEQARINDKNQPVVESEDHHKKSTKANKLSATYLIDDLSGARNLINTLLGERVRPPKLVLSIIGDSSSFVPKPWLIPVLKTGLIATAKGAKDYLILYKGSNGRISSIVQEAIDDLWNLREDGKEENLPEYKEDNFKSIEAFQTALCNTTVFAKFHAQTLKIIAEKEIMFMKLADNEDLIWRLPVLTVVAEGDLDTIDAIVQVLEINLPILLLKGSGKAADFVAGFIEEYRHDGASSKNSIHEYIKEKSAILFGIVSPRDKSLNKLRERLSRIHKCKCLITILDVNKETKPTNFTDSVTTSIIRGWSHISRDGLSNGERCKSPESSKCKETEESQDSNQLDESTRDLPRQTNETKTVTENALKTSTVPMKTGAFMEKYQATLSPASLPLFYYIAYQTIQDMNTTNKTQNFKILLKEAIIADRHEYVSVLLEGDKVLVGSNQVSDIYQKTLLQNGMAAAKTDFQGVFKWASKRAVDTLEKAYKLKEREYDLKCIDLSDKIIGILNKIIEDTPDTENLFEEDLEKIKENCETFKTNLSGMNKQTRKEKISAVVSSIQVLTSKMCIIAGRNICQSLLEYPKSTTIEWEVDCLYEDLLLWAILENRPNLASIFWMKSQNQLLCALLASCLYSKMAYKVKSTKDQSRYVDMIKQARIYEERSVYLQSKLYEENAALTMELVVTDFTVWDITISPLECAHENMMLDFISQSCCQRRLNKIWYNDIGGSFKGVLKKGLLTGCCFCFTTKNECRLRRLRQLRQFICSPLARFGLHYAFFFVAMVCYSAFLLTELDFIDGIQSVEMYEWIVYIHLLGDVLEQYRHVVKELLRFIGILLVFMMGVGVLYHANMYPKHKDMWNSAGWTYWRIWKIMYIPYWQIYGFNFLDSFDANSTTPCTTIQSEWESNPDIERCNRYDWVLIVIAAFYMLISNLLLVNLVIALFSFRFRRVQENSGKLWRYLRYEVIMDYRTIIPAPFNLIIRPIMLCMAIYRKLKRCRHGNDDHNQENDNEKTEDEIRRKKKLKNIETLQTVHAVNCVLEI
ncbi:uncharacterized protein LOC127734357 isoform X2 [Mytilus californianus]|uniref:uncharacterized protein LOC127734357 isoform X2 n=1 Tax=Mytilus californianus TaxID=6549 RepID=UPI002246DAAF|nr:uncharacterized protein LOC127734357 isoform X2 [Mytilus californianus]